MLRRDISAKHSKEVSQLSANANDIYYFGSRILFKALYNYQKENNFNILSMLDLVENENDPYYIQRYIDEHGEMPPIKRLNAQQFRIALRKHRRHIKRVSTLSNILAAAYKAFFFFVRSYQDSIYKILVFSTANKPGEYSSMVDILDMKNKCFRPEKPVSKLLESFPEYISWFLKFRELRNKVKTGIQTSVKLDEADPSIIFKDLSRLDEEIHMSFSVVDLVEALVVSTKLTNVTFDAIRTQGNEFGQGSV